MTIKVKNLKSKSGDGLDEEQVVQILLKQMLVTRIFAASYVGRFHVESLNVYRDVIQIFETEKELIRDLQIVKKRVEDFYKNTVWAAITGPEDMLAIGLPSNYNIWVQLQEVAFGSYWFMVEDVSISDQGEVIIKVKVIRNCEPLHNDPAKEDIPWDFSKTKLNLLNSLQQILTWHNTKESVKFMFLLIMTIFTALLHSLHYLGEYSIKFFREFNHLIHVCTPILIKLLDLLTKAIGGFYLLLVMLWRGRDSPPPSFPQMSIEGPPGRQRRFRPITQAPHQKYY